MCFGAVAAGRGVFSQPFHDHVAEHIKPNHEQQHVAGATVLWFASNSHVQPSSLITEQGLHIQSALDRVGCVAFTFQSGREERPEFGSLSF